MRFADNAFRFLNGTPNVPALYSARSGYEIVKEIGVAEIREKSLRQTQRLIDLADEAGIPVRTCREAEQRGGVVILDVPNGNEVTQELARRGDSGGLPAAGGHSHRAAFLYDGRGSGTHR